MVESSPYFAVDAIIGFARRWPRWAESAGVYGLALELESEIGEEAGLEMDRAKLGRVGRMLGLAEARLEAAVEREEPSGVAPSVEGIASVMSILSSAVWICVLVL